MQMKKFKRTIAGISAITMALSLSACGGGNNGGSTGGDAPAAGGNDTTAAANDVGDIQVTTTADTTTVTMAEEDVEAAKGAESLLREVELDNKVIKFLCHWDINPSEGQVTPVQLSLFQTYYGGIVQWIPTTWETRYSDLSTNVLGDTGVDFFQRDEDALPKGVVSGMFAPVDDYIDINDDLWSEVKAGMEVYNFNGKHYAFVTGMSADAVVYYNKQTIEENGFDDPWEMYENGEWNWDTFTDMLQTFVESADDHYGLDGWWSELALYRSGGVPLIQTKDGEIVININSPEIEKAQNFMLDVYNKGCVLDKSLFEWAEQPQNMGEGKELFFICGTWHVMNPPDQWSTKIPPENLGVVHIPNAPDAAHPSIPAVVDSMCLVKGGKNPLGVALYMECGLAAGKDEGANSVSEKQQRENFQWTDEVIDHMKQINELARQYPVVDIAGGISADVESLTTSNANKSVGLNASLHGVDWATTREELAGALDIYVGEVADALKAMA